MKATYHLDYIDEPMRVETETKCAESHFSAEPLVCHEERNAYVVPGNCVLTESGEVVDATGMHSGQEQCTEVGESEYIGGTTLYLGFNHRVWGHSITDSLKHLWFLQTEAFKEMQAKEPLNYVYIGDRLTAAAPFARLLKAADIALEDVRHISAKPAKCERLLIPDACFITKGAKRIYTQEFKALIDSLCQGVHPANYSKIYLSRCKQGDGLRDQGEKDIERVMKKLGFKIIYPERHTFDEQLALYAGCDVLATTEGSISHNAAFLKDGAKVIIFRKSPYANEYQFPINEMRMLDTTLIDAHLSVFIDKDYKAMGPFFLYCNDNVVRFAHDSGISVSNSFSIAHFEKYMSTCLIAPHLERRVKADEFYYKKVSKEIETVKQRRRDRLKRIPFLSESMRQKLILFGKKILTN